MGVAAGRLDELLAPLGPADDGPLVVCPSGALTAVPWAALPSLAARRLRVAPSGTLWCAARSVPRPARPEVVAVAGPGLLGAEAEVAGSFASTRGRVAVGAEAQVGAVLDAAATASVLHLAAHGRLRTDNPLFSTLELADGPLTGYDLESLAHVPETVVLSACSSGEGRAATAEETLGLAWTLLALGAATVVAPLLPVPDAATTEPHGRPPPGARGGVRRIGGARHRPGGLPRRPVGLGGGLGLRRLRRVTAAAQIVSRGGIDIGPCTRGS